RVLAKLMAKDPKDRPQTVGEVKALFQDLLANPGSIEPLDPQALDTWEKGMPAVTAARPEPILDLVQPGAQLVPGDDWAPRSDWEAFERRLRRGRRFRFFLGFVLVFGLLGVVLYRFRHSLVPAIFPGAYTEEHEPNNDYKTVNFLFSGKPVRGYLGKRID